MYGIVNEIHNISVNELSSTLCPGLLISYFPVKNEVGDYNSPVVGSVYGMISEDALVLLLISFQYRQK